jgi:cell division septation protein DedD
MLGGLNLKHAATFLFFLILAAVSAGCASKDMSLSNQGLQAISEGQYEQAEIYLGEALYINPDNPYALLNMGVLYHKTGRLEQARQMYRKVLELQPSGQADHSNINSSAGKSLVELARENLNLLDKEEAELAAARKKAAPIPPPPSVTPEETHPEPESPLAKVEEPVLAAPEPEMAEKTPAAEIQEGYYEVRSGDTLSRIAGRKDVYGDALKWPRLFRLNMEKLQDVKITESFPDQKLPEGLALQYAVRREASEHLAALPNKPWVINVASVQNPKRIVLYAVRLMKAGYHVYLTRAQVSGKDWTRLRVGFYANQAEASNAATQIKALLALPEKPWIIRIGKEEMENHAQGMKIEA